MFRLERHASAIYFPVGHIFLSKQSKVLDLFRMRYVAAGIVVQASTYFLFTNLTLSSSILTQVDVRSPLFGLVIVMQMKFVAPAICISSLNPVRTCQPVFLYSLISFYFHFLSYLTTLFLFLSKDEKKIKSEIRW